MNRAPEELPPPRRHRLRRLGGFAAAGGLLAAPFIAHALIRRRLRAPDAPRWGRTHRFTGRLGTLVFQQIGSGPPVVMLHAFGPGFDAAQWRGAAEALAPHFGVFAPDLPGWGRSAAPASGGLHPGPYLAALADFLAGVVGEPAVVVAAGLSAAYAVRLAAEHPAAVRALGLVAPLGLPLGDLVPDPAPAAALDPLLRLPLVRDSVLDALTSRAALGRFLRRRAYAAPERVDAALLEHHYRVSHLPAHRRALAAYWRGDLDPGAGDYLPGLSVPVWIALGNASATGAIASAAGTASTTPAPAPAAEPLPHLPAGSRLDRFNGSRQLPHAEEPIAFGDALGRFLRGLPA